MKGAILIDAGHFREEWKRAHAPRHEGTSIPLNHTPPASAVIQTISAIQTSVRGEFPADPVRWLRTYYYDAEPFDRTIEDPLGKEHKFGESTVYKQGMRLLRELRKSDNIAIRLGQNRHRDWKAPKAPGGKYSPVFTQKGVDMKIGLDIAWMATKRIVDIIILVTNDTDFVSPMKLARTEGVVVGVYCIVPKPADSLHEHADLMMMGSACKG